MNDGREFGFLDALTIMSVILQVQDHERDISRVSNDKVIEEMSRKIDMILENQRQIMERLAEMAD